MKMKHVMISVHKKQQNQHMDMYVIINASIMK